MAFVVDALVALAWCFRDEATAATDALLERVVEEDAAAPGLWFMETANALAMAERRGRITASTLRRSNALLQRLAAVVDEETAERAFGDILGLARSERLTVYDAASLELAMRLGAPLATKDAALRHAASRLGVQLLGA